MSSISIGKKSIRVRAGDRVFDIVNGVIMLMVTLAIVYPLYFILISSMSDPMAVQTGQTMFMPKGINFAGYRAVFEDRRIWISYRNTIFYTVTGVVINLAVTLTCAYALTRKSTPGRNIFVFLIVLTMLFDGGMIPRYLIVRGLGLYNTIWAMLLPRAASVFCILIARTFIQETIPEELYECAQSEGCSFARYFFLVVIPLSPALISILILNYGTGHWNSFFDAVLYLVNNELYPLQLVLRDILISSQGNINAENPEILQELIARSETVKYTIIIFASLPVLVVYPFLQKYFIRGVMIGAIKG
ncbi:MAG: carbohydrate ABC transporter permease [Oscillospiraceae bacterium]|nr:carbohydrate ABC transporter permease [Oscillospiraceae bacterium]